MPTNTPRWAATAIAIITAVTALVVAIANNGDKIVNVIHAFTPGQRAAISRQIASTPNPACNPALDAGRMGICHPQVTIPPGLLGTRVIHGIKGVDVSSYQGCSNNFRGVAFVITKFNESTGYRDPCARHNIAVARSRHIAHGGYDFLRPGRTSPSAEAATFVSVYKSTGARGVAVADVEVNDRGLSSAGLRSYVAGWVRYVHSHLPHATIIIYTGAWFWTPQVRGGAGSSNLWISAYANSFLLPIGFHSALMWQYSDGRFGPVPHINGWDSDVFLGSFAQFRRVFNGRVAPKPVSSTAKRNCAELNRIRKTRKNNLHRHYRPTLTTSQQRRATAIKRGERMNHIKCDKKGAHR